MKILRIILFPVVPIYYVVTWLRNWMYDKGIKSSKSYDFPVICVGNLSTGGTGKTPMIEYLIRLLKDEKQVATLSRGYKRITEGYLLANETVTVDALGDEPYQFFRKFKSIKVAVDENRQNGIKELMTLEDKPEVILLDDAYQHRKVQAGYNILLTSYNNLYYKDIVLPTGNLREPRSGAKRANCIVVTKCPPDVSESKKSEIRSNINLLPHQELFFSHIEYSSELISKNSVLPLEGLKTFTLVTGIANAQPLVNFLENKGLVFDHLEFTDHYNFRPADIELLSKKELIITTEKDYVRLSDNEELDSILYYLPITVKIDDSQTFDASIREFVD